MTTENPWNNDRQTQKDWNAKWNREDHNCDICEKDRKCTAIDRQNKSICKNLYERLNGLTQSGQA